MIADAKKIWKEMFVIRNVCYPNSTYNSVRYLIDQHFPLQQSITLRTRFLFPSMPWYLLRLSAYSYQEYGQSFIKGYFETVLQDSRSNSNILFVFYVYTVMTCVCSLFEFHLSLIKLDYSFYHVLRCVLSVIF